MFYDWDNSHGLSLEEGATLFGDGLLYWLCPPARPGKSRASGSYARVLDVVAELDAERTGAVAGFGTTARLLAGVFNLSKGGAKARTEQAGNPTAIDQILPHRPRRRLLSPWW